MNQATYDEQQYQAATQRIAELERECERLRGELQEFKVALCQRGENPDELTPQKAFEFVQLCYDLLAGATQRELGYKRDRDELRFEVSALQSELNDLIDYQGRACPGSHLTRFTYKKPEGGLSCLACERIAAETERDRLCALLPRVAEAITDLETKLAGRKALLDCQWIYPILERMKESVTAPCAGADEVREVEEPPCD